MARKRGTLRIDLSRPSTIDAALHDLQKSQQYFAEGGQKRLRELKNEVQTKFMNPMLMELGFEPGDSPPGNFAKRATPKQRRYYWWAVRTGKIKAGPGGKYIRTHQLSGGWRVEIDLTFGKQQRMTLRTRNNREYHIFVVGKVTLGQSRWSTRDAIKPQQPFHRYTGWMPAYPIIQKYYGLAKEYVDEQMRKWAEEGLP